MPSTTHRATIAALQHESRAGAIDDNLDRINAVLRIAAEQNVDLAVLPEAGLQGYGYEDSESVRRDASSLSDPHFERLRDLVTAAGLSAVVGFIERDGDRVFNSSAVVDPSGEVLAVHRKTHMPCLGVDRFVERGEREPPVVQTSIGRVGMLICADMIFPEAARVAALKAADVIAIPACVPESMTIYAEALIRVRAYENCVYVVYADMTGPDGLWRYDGRSQIADPSGRALAQGPAQGDAVLTAAFDPNDSRAKVRVREPREGIPHAYHVDFFGQRNPSLYGRIVQPDEAVSTATQSLAAIPTPQV
jgi:predicted amidohydrolase